MKEIESAVATVLASTKRPCWSIAHSSPQPASGAVSGRGMTKLVLVQPNIRHEERYQ